MKPLRHTKTLFRRATRSLGVDVSRTTVFGKNPFIDIRTLATAIPRLGFYAGANEGQTAAELRRIFLGCGARLHQHARSRRRNFS